MTREQLLQQQASARLYQERYEHALSPWGQSAPAPVFGQDVGQYRRDTLVRIKKLLPDDHALRIPVRKMPDDILDVFEPQILNAVKAEAHNPSSVPPGETRRVVDTDPNGLRIVKYVGNHSFIHDFTTPGRRVASFNTPNGPVAASGMFLRR